MGRNKMFAVACIAALATPADAFSASGAFLPPSAALAMEGSGATRGLHRVAQQSMWHCGSEAVGDDGGDPCLVMSAAAARPLSAVVGAGVMISGLDGAFRLMAVRGASLVPAAVVCAQVSRPHPITFALCCLMPW